MGTKTAKNQRRGGARGEDDGGTRNKKKVTKKPTRVSVRASAQVAAATSSFLARFRQSLDEINKVYENYATVRAKLELKHKAKGLPPPNVAEMMRLCYRGQKDKSVAELAAAVLGSEWKDDVANEENREREILPRQVRRMASFDWVGLMSEVLEEQGPVSQQLIAATVIPAMSTLLVQFVVLPRIIGSGRDACTFDDNVVTCFLDGAATLLAARKQGLLKLQFNFLILLCRRLGIKDLFLYATEAGAQAWLALGFQHLGSGSSYEHLRFDLLFEFAASRAYKIFSDCSGLYPMALNVKGDPIGDNEALKSAVINLVEAYGATHTPRLPTEAPPLSDAADDEHHW